MRLLSRDATEFNAPTTFQRDLKRVVAAWDKAVLADSANPHLYLCRAAARTSLGDRESLNRALNDVNQALQLKPDYADAYLIRVIVRRAKRDSLKDAMAELDHVVQLLPGKPRPIIFGLLHFGGKDRIWIRKSLAVRLQIWIKLSASNRILLMRS